MSVLILTRYNKEQDYEWANGEPRNQALIVIAYQASNPGTLDAFYSFSELPHNVQYLLHNLQFWNTHDIVKLHLESAIRYFLSSKLTP